MIDRNLHKKINTLLDFFPAVIILGVRQCGKTTLAKMIRPEWAYFDLERFQDFEFISRDFEFFIKENPHSIIIDEAQQYPELFSPSNQSSEKLNIWYFRSMRTGPVHQGPLQAELGSG